MQRNYHPYLTRSPGKFCLNCGDRIVVSPNGNWEWLCWKPEHGKRAIVGYVHNYNCTGSAGDTLNEECV